MQRNTIYSNRSTCSKPIVVTIDLPKDCRLNEEIIGERLKDMFTNVMLRDLCSGCPLEKPKDPSVSR